METVTFIDRVRAITEQIHRSDPAIAGEIVNSVEPDKALWQRDRFRATLMFHRNETPPRLSLQLANGEVEHPTALQIGFNEADVVNMIAVPVAALLTGHSEA